MYGSIPPELNLLEYPDGVPSPPHKARYLIKCLLTCVILYKFQWRHRFSGKNRHCGVPITRGVRYILAGFCGDDSAYAQQDDIDEEQERIDEEAIEEEDDQDGDAEAKELADEAEMDLDALLPPGYLAQRGNED